MTLKSKNAKRAKKRKQLWDEALVYKVDYCEACETQARPLHLHHIQHRTFKNWSNPENLITLCYVCHDLIHHQGKETFLKHFPHLRGRIANLENN